MSSGQSLCWCLGGSPRPPEIKHGLDITAPLQPVALDIPMPTDENELNNKFEDLVAELGLDKAHRDALYSLPPGKKWQIYCSKKADVGSTNQHVPDYYIEKMSAINSNLSKCNEEDVSCSVKLVENLKTALRTQTLSFVVSFIDLKGLQCLVDFLSKMDYETSEGPLHTAIIGCVKALMNNPQGRAHVLAHPDCINTIAQSLAVENIKSKIAVLEILGAICLVPGGHRKVLNAMLHFQKYAGERTRFQLLVCDLDRSTGKYREEVALKTAIMSFINAALNYGAGQSPSEVIRQLKQSYNSVEECASDFMDVFSKLRPSRMKKTPHLENSPSKEEIISTMENYSADRQHSNKENNNNAKSLSRGSSFDNKWEVLDSEPVTTPASLSHSYSMEWDNLFNRPDMMRKLREKATEGSLRSSRFRSVIWKLFLEVLPPPLNTWIDKTRISRSKFEELKNRLIVNPRKAVDSVDISLNNPLSQDEESPWNKFFQDNELRLTIKQDVIRTFPEVEFFRAPEMNELMIEILFCFCREHASNSYKQGMHELLAPLIFILHCDHQAFLHACEIESVAYCSEDTRTVMKEVMDPAYLEHDAYAMFCQVMETVEPWYLSREMFYSHSKSNSMRNLEMINATPFSRSQDLNPSSAIVTKLTRIQDYILKKFDPELHQHLERLEIVPQIYGIRWLRLLFGREFPMQDLLMLWDAIFADGIGFDLVDYVFVAMLMYIRDVLLTSDYATCLTVLMKYPLVPDVHYFVVKALWIREPNQHPRPPNYTHQGSIKTSSSIGSDVGNVSGASVGAFGISRDTSKGHKRQNVLGGFSSFSRKFSRPRTLAVPKSSSEPMNLQTDLSPDTANSPIGSTVSLSHVEESMFRHTPSASSLARMESVNPRSAQSSPGLRHSSIFPLTPDDASVTSSPTKYNTLPGKTKGKQKKLTQLEQEMQEKISRLQGELNDKSSMCRYCACKLDVHIGRLQQELSRHNIEIDDDIMVSLAGLKLVRDILNGTLKFTLTFAAEDDEIQINDDYYGNQRGGADSTGVTSPGSDILQGATSSGDDELKLEHQRHKLFYMSSEETTSPDSYPAATASFPTGVKGSNNVDVNCYNEGSNVPENISFENFRSSERKLFLEKDGHVGGDTGRGNSSSGQISSKSQRIFKSESNSESQSRKVQSFVQHSKDSTREAGAPASTLRTVGGEYTAVPHSHNEHPVDMTSQTTWQYSKQSQPDRMLADTRLRAKSNVESYFRWPSLASSPPERRPSKGGQSDYSDEEGRGERSSIKQKEELRVRGRSKSQPSAFSGSGCYYSLYEATGDKEHKTNPFNKL